MKRFVMFMTALFTFLTLAYPAAFAGKYDLKSITPEVNRALKGRQARYAQLQDMKRSGLVGENNKGFTASLKGDPAAETIVAAENRGRRVIYQALVDQNSLGPSGMMDVQRVFAEVQREKAAPGEKIQGPSGSWETK